MSRVHDMGGRFGDGRVVPEPEAEVFHEEWHGRALAVVLAAGFLGKWNIDVSRHARECLAPTDYARFSYYEKWMAGLADLLVAKGIVTPAELAGHADAGLSALAEKKRGAAEVPGVLATGGPSERDSTIAPRFGPGDEVVTRAIAENTLVEGGHTRLPQYAAGARGRILRLHGSHVLPDSSAHGLGDAAEPLYAVVFPAAALWAHPEHPGDEVVLDLWQSYLSPA
ncbi:nitrile hydratase subunit beta [Sulfitobacter sp. TSTF-M16]|uniref:nitrile hydratase n=1 Tax=Sulfitobacter aestuariivivens TaxID=2766981 RepID=A0A927CZN8_9RHOB|nr:nitrile hydratase subunit beta [Sulfitobacter aestuariivivens]MBD3662370.1 nitrile hydratase subunit beta [Sulfitobacter aestuariivivens]